MKKHADGLENSFLMMTAAEIGVRDIDVSELQNNLKNDGAYIGI